ncbi:hypothetical protein FRC01_000467 [Tulasnella sp. 417]|nr:hypothetical protein FRC01_000467 [Tulasnella sp. 417]
MTQPGIESREEGHVWGDEIRGTGQDSGVVFAEPEWFPGPPPSGSTCKLPAPTSAKGHERSLSGAALSSLTLSLIPSPDGQTPSADLAPAVELDMQPGPPRGSSPPQAAYTSILADPEFWSRLSALLLK